MPSQSVVNAFVEMVEAGNFVEAMERFYHADATAQENNEAPRVGLPALVAHERGTLSTFKSVRGRANQPVMIEGETVVINWQFEFDHPAGITLKLDEMVRQQWAGDKLISERFYYDPAQLRPRE